mmetsp:Transcript_42915/g.127205  ORF Transcript_42915/g.127205 Transcript_42915/m.127205 type:complete len:1482 (+) Transcript_42915:134-4579(+)
MGAALSGEVDVNNIEAMNDDAVEAAIAKFLRARPQLKDSLITRLSTPIDFEDTPQCSADDLLQAMGITLVYKCSWPAPRIHCRAGHDQPWTLPPGLKLGQSRLSEFSGPMWYSLRFPNCQRLEFVCNDGASQWDKASDGGNRHISKPGVWFLAGGVLKEWFKGGAPGSYPVFPEVAAAPQPTQVPSRAPSSLIQTASTSSLGVVAPRVSCTPLSGDPLDLARTNGGIVLVYHSVWNTPYLHFRCGDSEPWTQVPGQAMSFSNLDGFPTKQHPGGWFATHFPDAHCLEFVPNDKAKAWDKSQSGANYKIPSQGAWKLCAGKLEEIKFHSPAAKVDMAKPAPAAQVSWFGSSPLPPKVESMAPKAQGPPPVLEKPAIAPTDVLAITANSMADVLKSEGIVLLYQSSWSSPCVHGRIGEGYAWTAMPGLPLTKVSDSLVEGMEGSGAGGSFFALHFPKASEFEFVFNNGGPHFMWDKAQGGSNFRITTGTWLVATGRAEKVMPPPPPPEAPTMTSVTRRSVSLSWPPCTGGVKGYRIFRNGKTFTTVSGGMTSFTDSGLMASREYRYAVAALSVQGLQGPPSKETHATTESAGKPGEAQGLRTMVATGNNVKIAWTPPQDNGGAPITAYQVFRDGKAMSVVLAGSPDAKEEIVFEDKAVTKGATFKYTVTALHLPPKGPMRQKMQAKREATISPEDHDVLAAIPEELNEGPATSPLLVEAVDVLEIQAPKQDLREQLTASGITFFYQNAHWGKCHMHCMAKPELGWTELPGLKVPASKTFAFPSSEGWYSVHMPYARNLELVMTDGNMAWDKAPGGTNYKITMGGVFLLKDGHIDSVALPPQKADKPEGKPLDGSRVSLTWKPVAVGQGEAPVVAYKVFRNGVLVNTARGTSCTFVDKNLFAFTDYEYAVAPVNSQSVSGPLSDTVNVKTDLAGPPSAPRNLRARINKGNATISIALEWEPPEDCGGAPVASYEVLRDGIVVSVYEVAVDRLRSEAEACQPIDPDAGSQKRWVRSTCSYSTLSWFKDGLEWEDTEVGAGEIHSYQVRAVQLDKRGAGVLKGGGLQQRCGSRFLDMCLDSVCGPACEPTEVRCVPFLDPPKIGERKTWIMFQTFDWDSCKANSWYTHLLGLLPELRTAGINMMWLPPPSDSVDDHAYLPKRWFVLDNKYGSAEALQKLVTAMHQQDMIPMLDVVVNHRCASLQDSAGRWLKFEEPDWEGWAVCHDSPAVPGGTGNGVSGEPAQYAPSVDHQNPRIREDVNAFIRHMMEDIGFRALRFDFVKGYAPKYQKDYVKAAGSPYAVAENWNGDPNGLHDYVRQCEGVMAVYDFPLYYTLKRCVHSNNFCDLNENGKPAGICGRDPARSVTFIDNHDTYQLAIVGGAFGNNEQVLRGYAYILTHPGVPCVFHYDYARGDQVKAKLLELCSIRNQAGIHATSPVNICRSEGGLYAAIIDGKVAVKIGTNEWLPGGGWRVAVSGNEFCVWMRG